ncbi:hypothetical protein AAF712_014796 [Marasmius tenuissimus]|uniref:Uncharacterized protein n=1 Tax=Marasmius tenuissimus TaxID=585030 RepID=A0ABR2ZB98_9AGAR
MPMRHSKFTARYPACVKAGLDVGVGKLKLKGLVEEHLKIAVMEAVPLPLGHTEEEVSLHIPPHGDEEGSALWQVVQDWEGLIARLLQARLELSRPTNMARGPANKDRGSKAPSNPSTMLRSRRAVVPASVLDSVRVARNREAAPAGATGKVLVSVEPDLVVDLEAARTCDSDVSDAHTVCVDVRDLTVHFLRSDLARACSCATEIFALDESFSLCVIMGMRYWEESLKDEEMAAQKTYAPDPTHYKIHRGKPLGKLTEEMERAERSQGQKRGWAEVGGDLPETKRMKALILCEEPAKSAALKSGFGVLVEDEGEWDIISCHGLTISKRLQPMRGRKTG